MSDTSQVETTPSGEQMEIKLTQQTISDVMSVFSVAGEGKSLRNVSFDCIYKNIKENTPSEKELHTASPQDVANLHKQCDKLELIYHKLQTKPHSQGEEISGNLSNFLIYIEKLERQFFHRDVSVVSSFSDFPRFLVISLGVLLVLSEKNEENTQEILCRLITSSNNYLCETTREIYRSRWNDICLKLTGPCKELANLSDDYH
jgi:hypothetical protein